MSKRTPCVVVCVTNQFTCASLIAAGAARAQDEGWRLRVVHVAQTGQPFLAAERAPDALDQLFSHCKTAGCDMTVLQSGDVVKAILDFARRANAKMLVVGRGPSDHPNALMMALQEDFEGEIFMVAPVIPPQL
ncbi:MAG: universal stress protein UspA [Clostridia bacterium]|nr:universal stress protein UspA [Clostridia bacterium]